MSNVVFDYFHAEENLRNRAEFVLKYAYPKLDFRGFIGIGRTTIEFVKSGTITRIEFEADTYHTEIDCSCNVSIDVVLLIDPTLVQLNDDRICIINNATKHAINEQYKS